MNETISRAQAKRIIDGINKFALDCRNLFVDKSQEFAFAVSKAWEDNAAVICFKNYKNEMEEIINFLQKNTSNFVEIVEDIHNRYARAGNMPLANFAAVTFSSNVDVSAVQNHFNDEFESFGFRDPKKSAQEVVTALDDICTSVTNGLDSLISEIKGIPAFGNSEVQGAIARLARTTNDSVRAHYEKTRKMMIESVDAMAQKYTAAGTESVVTATEAMAELDSSTQSVAGSASKGIPPTSTGVSPENSYNPRPVVKPSDISGQTDVSAMIE